MFERLFAAIGRVENLLEQLLLNLCDLEHIRVQTHRLKVATDSLRATVAAYSIHPEISEGVGTMAGPKGAVLDDLTTQVSNTVGVEASAATLIQGFAAALAAAGTDPVKLKALQDQLKSSADALAAAVAANPIPAPKPPTP